MPRYGHQSQPDPETDTDSVPLRTKIILFSVFTLTLLSIAMSVTLLFNSAPDSHKIIAMLYGTAILALTGVIFFIFYIINWARFQENPPWTTMILGLRYGLLVSIYLAILLLLNSQRLLNYPDGITILVIIAILELLWRRRKATKILR